MKHLGWILDLYHKPGQMVVWLKNPDGKCVRLTDRWKPRIHVGGNYRELIDLACTSYIENSIFVDKFERAGDIEKSRVLEVVVENDEEAARLARRIQRESSYCNFRLYDVDVPSPQIYLYQKDLFPLALVEAEEKDEKIEWTLRDSRETIDYKLPPLRKIRLEVRTRKSKRIRTFEDELDSVSITDREETLFLDSGNEEEKLLSLIETFKKIDPDIVITEGGDSFIFPYLARRAHKNGMLNRLILGRDPSPLRVYEVQGHSYFSYGKILYRETAARLLGRLHIDDHNAFISADCGLEGLFEISRTCIIPIQRASRATIGTNMTSLQFYHAVKKDVLIPWNKNQPEEWKNANELVVADRGGFIHEPETGIYDQVGELDFSSLYPTLMLKNNLSGETVNCKCCVDSTLRVPELNYNICRRPGIVPLSLEIILRRRAEFKRLKKAAQDESTRSKFDARQSALKWILVCCLSPDSPVLTLQNGRVKYQQIGRIVDHYLGESMGVVDCPEELFVAGVDNNLKSKFCKVSKLIKVLSPRKLLRIRLEDGRQVNCTSNHSFYVLKSGRLVETKAEDLSRGDLVPVAKHVVSDNVVSSINLLENIREKIGKEENDLWRAKSESLRPLVKASSNKLGHVLRKENRPIQNLGVWRESGIVPFRYLQLLSPSENASELLIGRGRREGGHVAWLPASLRLEGRNGNCHERARESLRRITQSTRFPTLKEAHSRIEKLLEADLGFVAVREIAEIETTSPYVYCFQIAHENNLPAFFTGSGGVLVHNCFGYLGFKNARFGKIDAHIATCAFSRVVLSRAVAIAQARGFKLVHGIVDSMWLTKADATAADYEELCSVIRKDLDLPLSFEGQYRWIVFLNSKTDPQAPVLNRYYGIFQDRTLKVRGIDVRRHDTPKIVEKCQEQMLAVLKEADNSQQFQALIPQVLNTLREYASKLRSGAVPIEELVITKNLSKMPNEYTHLVPQAIAAQYLIDEGATVHAGQQVSYVLTIDASTIPDSQALPPELADDDTVYDSERYVDLLVSSTANLLLPFGYDVKSLTASLGRPVRAFHSRPVPAAHQLQIQLSR
ncbi:MAG TPA: DNA polymerase domain-containing protein [Candidatus Angelobacter sp.]|nr:DNA polymerase domain-containing protein [Candidatus Angelobacter sp.]